MKDILLVLSDQHSGVGNIAHTPFLDRMAENGQCFENAYCNNPLCVPSRMSFLSGKYPHELGIYDNNCILDSEIETLADKLNKVGYETILVGRMHFKGFDQYHGFQKRFVGDITTQFWPGNRNELKDLKGTQKASGCLNEVGYGDSFTQEFDEAVLNQAIKALQEKRNKPLFMVVGFYGPHFPYIVSKNYFRKYFSKVNMDDYYLKADAYYEKYIQNTDMMTLRHVRASYYGLIEKLDNYCCQLHETFRNSYKDGIFIYTSDHGDMLGKYKIFGKKVLYEESIKIPLYIEDLRIPAKKYKNPISLFNLHYTILSYADIAVNEKTCFDNNDNVYITSYLDGDFAECYVYESFKTVKIGDQIRQYDKNDNTIEINTKQNWLNNRQKVLKKYFDLINKTSSLKALTKDCKDEIMFKFSEKAVKKPRRVSN